VLTRRSAITFISYAPNLKIEKPNNLKVFGSNKAKGPNRIAKYVMHRERKQGPYLILIKCSRKV
jgi:hypothetical protein